MILTELTFAILKYSFLVLLWVFVWFAVRSLRKDIEIFSPKKSKAWKNKSHRRSNTSNDESLRNNNIASANLEKNNQAEMPTLLVIIDGPLAGSSFPLEPSGVTLGRSANNTVVLNDEFVSSHHARVYFNQSVNSWVLEDLGSTNGTMIGHSRVNEPVVLPPRKPVRIGATMFELR
ncbi:FHA domain-containing protein FhaB [Gardnerella vaginalis]|uniref:FHA domain-containing protein FhaB/FipA n=1 Tax=Gardnerella vaginalis TaxID=2702 RepID=UPI0039EE32BF